MASFFLYVSQAYLFVAVGAVLYRLYGFSARALARHTAHNVLRNLQGMRSSHEELVAFKNTVADIFSDSVVNEDEFGRFAEIALASYIAEKEKTIKLLRRAVMEQDIEIRILGYMLQRTLRDRAYLEGVVSKLSSDGRKSAFGEAMVNFFARHRLEGFAVEFSNIIALDFPNAPRRVDTFVDVEFLRRVERMGSNSEIVD